MLRVALLVALAHEEAVKLTASERDWRAWSRRSMAAAVVAEMQRSIASSPQPHNYVPSALLSSDEPMFVLVFEKRIITDARFLVKEKNRKHLNFVASMIDHGYDVPNVLYTYSGNSTGECTTSLPCCVIAKKTAAMPGILVPNPYFHDLDFWAAVRGAITHAASARPFEARDQRVFWRGHIQDSSQQQPDCADENGNFARLEAMTLSLEYPSKVSVGCWLAKKCAVRDDRQSFCPQFRYYDNMNDARDDSSLLVASPPGHTPKENFSNYKYVLNLPGSTQGSYSRNLNHLWFLDSVVMLWRAQHAEWYYPGLTHGETHLTVDRGTLVTLRDHLEDHSDEARRLRHGARDVDDNLLCPACLANYHMVLFDALRTHLGLPDVLDDPCAATKLLASLNCSRLNLVQILPSTRHSSKFDFAGRRLSTNAVRKDLMPGCTSLVNFALGACRDSRRSPDSSSPRRRRLKTSP